MREADILISQGKAVAETMRVLGITDVTYYRWRKEYGGMKVFEAWIEQWRQDYNIVRPQSTFGFKPPAPEAIQLKYRKSTKKKEKRITIH